jgi:hypothetical protein
MHNNIELVFMEIDKKITRKEEVNKYLFMGTSVLVLITVALLVMSRS